MLLLKPLNKAKSMQSNHILIGVEKMSLSKNLWT